MESLLEVVKAIKPTVLLGLSGQPGSFTEDIIKVNAPNQFAVVTFVVLQAMYANCPQPVIFALSNPTPKAEATPEQLYT